MKLPLKIWLIIISILVILIILIGTLLLSKFESWFGPLLIGLFYRRLNIHKSFALNLS